MLVNPDNSGFLNFFDVVFGVKAFLILFLVFYIFFAFILFRQISIMNKKLPTSLSPLLKFIGIVHLGFAIALLFLVLGNFR